MFLVMSKSPYVADNLELAFYKSEDMNYTFLSAFTNFSRLHNVEENDHVTSCQPFDFWQKASNVAIDHVSDRE